jgi:hypothetical protein
MIQQIRIDGLHGRVEDNWRALQADIEDWLESLAGKEGGIVLHHLEQFRDFCQQAHECLWNEADKFKGWSTADDKISYRALLVGVLTSQWMQLRQALSQRLADSPYQAQLQEFDIDAHIYYYRLYEALPAILQSHPSLSSPIIYLGRLAELTFFNPQAPGLLSVPFGAVSHYAGRVPDNRSLLAIPHEVSHAIFERIPGLTPELQSRVMNDLANQDPKPTRKEGLVHKVIVNWMTEIIADMAGTALVGPEFARSALVISIAPDDMVGVTDHDHPVGLIRPFIHLATLQYLAGRSEALQAQYQAGIDSLSQDIKALSGIYLDRRFESLPALTIVTLGQVKAELDKVIARVFEQDLVTLANQSIGDILFAAATRRADQLEHKQPREVKWGQIKESCDNDAFVLDISRANQPEYGAAGNFQLKVCCDLGLSICC